MYECTHFLSRTSAAKKIRRRLKTVAFFDLPLQQTVTHDGTGGRERQGDRTSMAVSSQRGGRALQTRIVGDRRRNNPRVAQHSDGGADQAPLREALPLALMLPVTAPAIFPGVVKAWVKQQAPALRGWVTSALIGTGLTRHVPSTENKLEPHQVFDSFLASTKGLTSELVAALRRYVIYIHVHVNHYNI
jgi:hypothetical protein